MPDRILVADDEPDLLNAAKIMLEKGGYQVIEATNGDEALEKVNSEKPDLIILDVVMPGKTGTEVCKILKEDPQTSSIPILMYTVLGREADSKISEEVGADGHLIKPFSPEDLVATVKKHLELSRSKND
ncbi:MAG: response regulator [Candidatus Bathyarchaeota archaeon]|nr:response regulator [Candidatus Bathyarchaeota archaeon]